MLLRREIHILFIQWNPFPCSISEHFIPKGRLNLISLPNGILPRMAPPHPLVIVQWNYRKATLRPVSHIHFIYAYKSISNSSQIHLKFFSPTNSSQVHLKFISNFSYLRTHLKFISNFWLTYKFISKFISNSSQNSSPTNSSQIHLNISIPTRSSQIHLKPGFALSVPVIR